MRPPGETASDRESRIVEEARQIAAARAELDAGLYVDADEIDAWIDSLDTDHERPAPATRQR